MADIHCFSQKSDFAILEHGVFSLDDAIHFLHEYDKKAASVCEALECRPMLGFEDKAIGSFLTFTRLSDCYEIRFMLPDEFKIWFLRFPRCRERFVYTPHLPEAIAFLRQYYDGVLDQQEAFR